MRTRVKICGITRPDDAVAAAHAGADAIGLVFDPTSPRAVNAEQAGQIVAALPPFVVSVALFVDAASEAVRSVLQRVPVALLQFHGDESPEYCAQFGKPYLKAIRMREGIDVRAQERRYKDATGLLLDTYVPGVAGGSGHRFDWVRIPRDLTKPIVLAGGLTAENVGAAVRQVRPAAVDVSSGVEASKGRKDLAKVTAFIDAVRAGELE